MFLDTTCCIDLLREARRGRGPATVAVERLGEAPLLASVFVICELQAGARLAADWNTELRRVERLTDSLLVVHPDESFAVVYAETEVVLRRSGTPIPTMDLLIGVTAKMRGIPLLTRDTEHYRRIPGLVVETY